MSDLRNSPALDRPLRSEAEAREYTIRAAASRAARDAMHAASELVLVVEAPNAEHSRLALTLARRNLEQSVLGVRCALDHLPDAASKEGV